jgi:hypothetical protein
MTNNKTSIGRNLDFIGAPGEALGIHAENAEARRTQRIYCSKPLILRALCVSASSAFLPER